MRTATQDRTQIKNTNLIVRCTEGEKQQFTETCRNLGKNTSEMLYSFVNLFNSKNAKRDE